MNRSHSNHKSQSGRPRPKNRAGGSRPKPGKRPFPPSHAAHKGPGKGTGGGAGPSQGSVIGFDIVDRSAPAKRGKSSPFRVLIAVHRPRYRGRSERAAALTGWEVTALLNKQDPVGMCAKAPRPPDILVLSGDFGRQKDYAIFRAVQRYRSQGMLIVGLVDDAQTPPEGFPDSAPVALCDVCLEPPYKTAEIRSLLEELYEELRGEPAPPPLTKGAESDTETEEEE